MIGVPGRSGKRAKAEDAVLTNRLRKTNQRRDRANVKASEDRAKQAFRDKKGK